MNKKYSTEFKFKVVQEYQKGEKGSHILGHEMNIHPSMVLSWYHLYKQHGIDGLRTRRTASPYSEEFKVENASLFFSIANKPCRPAL